MDMHLEDCSEACFFDFRSYNEIDADCSRSIVYMKRWQKLMLEMSKYGVSNVDENGETILIDRLFIEDCYGNISLSLRLSMINDILGHIPTAHTCRIASTLIHWIAEESKFLKKANKLCDEVNADSEIREIIYQGLFSTLNQRNRTYNSGQIPLDNITNKFRQHSDIPQFFYGLDDMESIHKDAMHDIQTINLMFRWLASDEGQDFINGCEHNIQIKLERKQAAESFYTQPTQQWLSKRPTSPVPSTRRASRRPTGL